MSCEYAKEQASGNPGVQKFQENPLSQVKHVIAVASGKGGVGKSMVSAMVASYLKKAGWQVGILDADITGPSIPRMFGCANSKLETLGDLFLPTVSPSGIKLISANLLLSQEDVPVLWRGPVLAGAIRQFWSQTSWGPLDYLVVDMPPGTGDVALTVFQSLPVDGVIVVSTPQDLVQMVVGKACNMAEKMHIPIIGLVENMAWVECQDCGKRIDVFGPSLGAQTAEHYGIDFLGSLPIDSKLAAASDSGTFFQKLPDGLLDAAIQKILALPDRQDPEQEIQDQADPEHKQEQTGHDENR